MTGAGVAGGGGGAGIGGGPVPAFGALLRGHRRAAGLTQEALAERAGLSRRGLQHLEAGDVSPHPATLEALVAALDLAPDERTRLGALVASAPSRPPPAAGPATGRWGGRPGAAAGLSNLPLPLTSFVGREREVAAVAALLGAQRLVTLTGPGGTGKTRLALQVAAEVLAAYPQGVWLVELGALADPALVPHTAAAAVGVPEEPGRRQLVTLVDTCARGGAAGAGQLRAPAGRVRPAGPRPAASLPPPEPALHQPRAPGPHGRDGVARPLPPRPGGAGPAGRARPTPGPARGSEDLTRYAAVRLFCERAAAVQPGFALSAENAAAVAEVCVRLDGIPWPSSWPPCACGCCPHRSCWAGWRTASSCSRGAAAPPWSATRPSRPWWTGATTSSRRRSGRSSPGWRSSPGVGAGGGRGGGRRPGGAGIEPGEVLDLLTRLVDQSLVVAEAQAGRDGALPAAGDPAAVRPAAPGRPRRRRGGATTATRRTSSRSRKTRSPGQATRRTRTLRAARRGWTRSTTTWGRRCAGGPRGARRRRACAWPARCGSSGTGGATSRRGARGWRPSWRSRGRGAPPGGAARLKALAAAGRWPATSGDHAGGAYWAEGLALARALGDRPASVRALNGLGPWPRWPATTPPPAPGSRRAWRSPGGWTTRS